MEREEDVLKIFSFSQHTYFNFFLRGGTIQYPQGQQVSRAVFFHFNQQARWPPRAINYPEARRISAVRRPLLSVSNGGSQVPLSAKSSSITHARYFSSSFGAFIIFYTLSPTSPQWQSPTPESVARSPARLRCPSLLATAPASIPAPSLNGSQNRLP